MLRLKALGIVGALVAYPFMLASVLLTPWFNGYDNALSDLGNTITNGNAAYVYNAGLILSGGTVLVFALLLSSRARDWRVLVWTVPMMLGSFDLCLVGVFSENAGSIHQTVSEVFFFMIVVTMIAYSYVSWPLGSPGVGAVALSFGIASAVIWFVKWPWPGVAIQEFSTSGLTAILLVLISIRLR